MRHLLAGRKLGRTTSHRWALFCNQMASLVQHERIRTTLPKAKEMKRLADRLITVGKQDTLAARRRAFALLRNRDLVRKLFGYLAVRFKDRNGGYTRIYKAGFRAGDGAPVAIIEYLPAEKGAAASKAPPAMKKAATAKKAAKKVSAKPVADKKAGKETKKAKAKTFWKK